MFVSSNLTVRTNLIKYPRTPHLPWSEDVTNDDKVMPSLKGFVNQHIIVTEKMDGENTTMYCDHIHARSVDSKHHPSRDWTKQFWSQIKHDIPPRMRICGENVYAKHSIYYTSLESYFLGFSIWEDNICLSWNQTIEWFELLGVSCVPVLYEGPYTSSLHEQIWSQMNPNEHEGYVVRIANSFTVDEFPNYVGKFVRQSHVQTNKHWKTQQIIPNKLRNVNG